MKRMFLLLTFVLVLIIGVGCSNSGGEESDSNEASGEESDSNETSEGEAKAPEGDIELMASYAPGGGHDTMLRAMMKVLTNDGIIENSLNVTNNPGGSGAVGLADATSNEGNDNYIFAVTSSFLTTPLQGNIEHTFEDYTPVARLGEDPYVVLVNSESGIENFEDFNNYIKNENATFGGTSVGGGSHILAEQIAEAADTTIEYVPFEGDGEVTTALLGQHVDVIADNIGASLEYIENGDMIPIAVSTNERLEDLPDVPTLQESGYDIEWSLFRGIYGPPNMSEEVRMWYEEKMKELSESESWHEEYLEPNKVEEGFMTGEEFEEYLTELNGEYESYMTELGIIE